MLHRRFTRCASTVLAAIAVGAVGFAVAPPAAAAIHVEQYVEVPQCQPNTSQECPQRPEVKFTVGRDDGDIQATFTANANHCSDILVRFLVDNYPQGDFMRAGPSQTVSVGFRTKSGDRVLSVQAKGVDGGCNTGVLNAWGGTVHLDTVDAVGPAPVKTPCKWTLNSGGNIMRGRDLRFTFGSWQGHAPAGPFHMYAANGTTQLDHGEILYSTPDGDNDVDFGIVWIDEHNNRWRDDEYKGTFDPASGTLRGTVNGSDGSNTDWSVNEFFTCS
jgi:hypothetical protein